MRDQPIMRRIRWHHLGALAPLFLLGVAERAIAHGAVLEYNATQAYEILATYDSGTPMVEAQVAIFSPENPSEPWMTGVTDAEGRFLFTPPTPGNWEVQVRQAGHGDLVVIPVAEGAIAATPAAESTDAPPAAQETAATSPATPPNSSPQAFTGLQKGLMAGSVVWGFVGTALFFSQKGSLKKR